ncbi:hypothetical protein J6590_084240 [Homalodisca vitripennis]|nr:hypothetical protein J6590_084240 [Homalodisca vitripennis]
MALIVANSRRRTPSKMKSRHNTYHARDTQTRGRHIGLGPHTEFLETTFNLHSQELSHKLFTLVKSSAVKNRCESSIYNRPSSAPQTNDKQRTANFKLRSLRWTMPNRKSLRQIHHLSYTRGSELATRTRRQTKDVPRWRTDPPPILASAVLPFEPQSKRANFHTPHPSTVHLNKVPR